MHYLGSHSRGMIGIADEVIASIGGGAPAWTIDADSGLAFPANAIEEAAFVAAHASAGPAASLIYNCQEGSGDLAEANGGLPLIAGGAVSYGVDVAGYSRNAVSIADGNANTGFSNTDASLPSPVTANYAMLIVARSTGTPAGGRGFFHLSEDNQCRATTAPRMRPLFTGDDRQVALDIDTNVHFFFGQVDETANSSFCGWEDAIVNMVYSAPASAAKRIGVGGFDAASFGCDVLAVYVWLNAVPTKAQLKARIIAHGKSVAWS